MLKTNKHCLIYLFISGCLMSGACVPSQRSVKDTLGPRSIFETGIDAGEIQAEIEGLQGLTEDKSGKAVSVDVYLRLAVLYSSYRNEDADYASALTALENYMGLHVDRVNEPEINTLHSLLLKIKALSDDKTNKRLLSNNRILREKNKVLIEDNKVLIEEKRELEKNNELLKETIEKLGSIDLKLEQKRKSFK